MKKMKKTISFIIAVVMMLSVVPVQTLAASPTLEKVEFIDNTPISNQYIQYVAELNPELGKKQLLYEVGNDYKYYYKLYFSNGRTLNTLEGNYQDEYWACGIKWYHVETYVDVAACQKAIDEGRSTVKVTVSVELDKLIGKDETVSFEVEKEIVEGYVKSVKLIGDMPENIGYDGYIADDLDGREVEIEYYDARKEIKKIVCEDEEDTPFCYIDDESASLYYFETVISDNVPEAVYIKGISIDYLDVYTEIVRIEKTCPFQRIELLDYKLDGAGGLAEVTYRLTCNDGRVIEKTCSVNGPKDEYGHVVIDTVDGYDVVVYLDAESTYYDVVIEIEDMWRIVDWIDGDSMEKLCNCICHKNGILYIFGFIMTKIWKLLRINEYCKCGAEHWYKY